MSTCQVHNILPEMLQIDLFTVGWVVPYIYTSELCEPTNLPLSVPLHEALRNVITAVRQGVVHYKDKMFTELCRRYKTEASEYLYNIESDTCKMSELNFSRPYTHHYWLTLFAFNLSLNPEQYVGVLDYQATDHGVCLDFGGNFRVFINWHALEPRHPALRWLYRPAPIHCAFDRLHYRPLDVIVWSSSVLTDDQLKT